MKRFLPIFRNRVGQPTPGSKPSKSKTTKNAMSVMEETAEYLTKKDHQTLTKKDRDTLNTYHFLLLAYLDSAGYAERSARKAPLAQFRAILERYLFVAEKIQHVLAGLEMELAPAEVLEGDARSLSLDDNSTDGIIFSPPYSFAVDYLANDSFHLNFMGIDSDTLRDKNDRSSRARIIRKVSALPGGYGEGSYGMRPCIASRLFLYDYRWDQQQPIGKGLRCFSRMRCKGCMRF